MIGWGMYRNLLLTRSRVTVRLNSLYLERTIGFFFFFIDPDEHTLCGCHDS